MNQKSHAEIKENRTFSSEELGLISFELEKFHGLFYVFWGISNPQFAESINGQPLSTLCVTFDEKGHNTGLFINPNFWDSLTNYEKIFYICHECLHVSLNHGIRALEIPLESRIIANQAMDVIVHESLVSYFKFNRSQITNSEKFCWFDTVFPNQKIDPNKTFEHYYNLLIGKLDKKQLANQKSGSFSGKSEEDEKSDTDLIIPDDHSGFYDHGDKISEMINEMEENLNDMEKESIKKFIDQKCEKQPEISNQGGKAAGTSPGGSWKILNIQNVKKKKKWETVINKWASKYLTENHKEAEQWARINRRLSFVSEYGLLLPSDMEIDEFEEDEKKIDVWFFQDTSGSCAHLAERFFKAAKTLPPNRFNIRMFCFDTSVYETSLKTQKLYGFGGTCFVAIEKEIQKLIKNEKIKYPDSIFVVTDGYGTNVAPQFPKKWYWFLSENHTSCIPKESKTFMLKDFE